MDANAVYAERFSTGEHEALAAVRERTRGALPERAHMLSGAVQGQLLGMLAALSNARRVLEVGCFTGYSALAVASALSEDGKVFTIERDAAVAAVARANIAASPWARKVEVVEGDGREVLERMAHMLAGGVASADEHPLALPSGLCGEAFDMVFVDANKKQYSNYYNLIFDGGLLRVGGILLVDNVLWKGKVPQLYGLTEEERRGRTNELERKGVRALVEADKYAEAMHAFNVLAANDPRAQVVLLPLRDGLSIIRRVA